MCISSSSTLTDEVRKACLRMCLKSLWYYAKVYHQLGTSKQLPPYFLHVITTPEITRRIQQEEDLTSRVIGHCFEALVVTKLAADINSGTVRGGDQELACLSGILGAEIHDVKVWLKLPGAIEHMGLFFLVLSEVATMDTPLFPFPTFPTLVPPPTVPPSYPLPGTGMSPMYPVPGTGMSPMNRIPGTSTSPIYLVPGMSSRYHTPGISTSPMYRVSGTSPMYRTLVTSMYPIPGAIMSSYNPTPGATVFPYPTPTPVFPISRTGDGEKLDVWDVVQQTFSILFHTLPAATDTEHRVGKFGGGFGTILQNWLDDLLGMCTKLTPPGTSPPTNEVRITCLTSLWYHEIACHCLRAPRSLPALDLFPIHFITPEIAHRLQTEEDHILRVIGCCFVSLVVNRFAAKFNPSGDRELASLSAIIGPGVRAMIHRPGNLKPGAAVQVVNLISLTSDILSSLVVNTVPSDVQYMVRQTISTLSQALPADLKVELHLDQADALMNIPDSTSIKSIIVSLFHDLLKTCTLRTFALSEEARASSLQMCLQGLWNLGQELHWQQRGGSQPSAPEFLDLVSPEITRHLRSEKDQVCRVKGRCVEALVVSHLAARTDPTVQTSDEALGRISTILGTESRDVRLWLGRPGTVELANMVSLLFSEIDSLFSDTTPLDVLDMIQGTLSTLSPTLLAKLDAELMDPGSIDDQLSEKPPYSGSRHEPPYPRHELPYSRHRPRSPAQRFLYETHSRTCLKYLWHCARAYNQLGAEMPLPSFVSSTLSPDISARVTGRCFGALISRISFSSGVYDAELACISSILDTRPGEILRWPHPSAVKLLNVMPAQMPERYSPVVLMPVDMLNVVQQTINIISPDLVLGGAFARGDLPMDQVSLLHEICSKIANARPEHRFRNQTMGILDQLQQISKQLPAVERRIRRCTSSIFGPQFVRGRV
ncbi:hypothetical protein EDB89DRAFT_1978641 [Lactarius sanguifluus]|nr:hypothetical protein EDB89DRAFT_1978641 [Lactarius sanguifluus]